MTDSDWLTRVRHRLAEPLQREYERRMRTVRAHARLYRWRYEPAERAVG